MKYLKFFFLAAVTSVALWSCGDDELGPVIEPGAAPVISAPTAGSAWTLVEADADLDLPAFTWSAADFGFPSGTEYELQVDAVGNDFGDAVTLAGTNGLTATLTQGELNNILLAQGYEGGTTAALELRVVATVSDEVAPLVSAPVGISITPYESTVVLPQLQVPGNYQSPEWDPTNNTTIIFSPGSNNEYEGFLYFGRDATEYKFTQGPSWETNWGDDGGDGTLDPGGANLTAPTTGVYRLRVNLNNLTHSNLATNWGLVGSATPGGWDVDTDMVFDADKRQMSITLDLAAGAMKFRANDAWDINLGDDGANGSLEYNGADIVVAEAGNYTIDLNILGVAKYTYTVTKN